MENVHQNCTPFMKVHKNVLPPFPITTFLRLVDSAICDITIDIHIRSIHASCT